MKNLMKHSISAVTVFDDDYPIYLKTIYDPPWVLYGQGDWSTLNQVKMISVVGTRNLANKENKLCKKYSSPW